MPEKFSVQAILSARDKDFTVGMKGASAALSNLKSSVTSGLGFGILAGIGQRAFDAISGSVTGLIGDLNDSSAAWKTFSSTMEMNGKTEKQIKSIKNELQDFATKTIYSASDMASTFAQLDAVGTKNTTNLVKGFGGLAAAAEEPKQAMKTLSQQATQMAAKPKVAWEDFKLMLEQTPAGIAAVAEEMGMSTQELIKNVQDGKIKTEDFFDAISKVGTNDAFTKLATQYKTVGQAMDGLTETASNKLAPAFDVVSTMGINAVSRLVDSMEAIDGEALAGKVTSFVTTAGKYWDVFKDDVGQIASAYGDAISAISSSLGELNGAFGSTESIEGFSGVLDTATGILTGFAGVLETHSDTIALVIDKLPTLFIAYKGFKIVTAIAPGVSAFSGAILKLTAGGVGKIAGRLLGIAAGEKAAGNAGKTSSKQMLTSAKAFMMMGAAVLMVSAGFALLAHSAVSVANAGPAAIAVLFGLIGAVAALGAGMTVMLNSIKPGPAKLKAISVAMLSMGAAIVLAAAGFTLLSNAAINLAGAGPLAIACMVGMVASIALLAAGAAALGPALTAGAIGFIAFGAAIVLVGVGALAASAALSIVAGVLPTVAQYGMSGAAAIAALGASMIVFAAGAALAGAGAIVLGAGLTVVGAGALVAAAGVLVLGAAVLVLSAGILVAAAGVTVMGAALPVVGSGATSATAAITGFSSATLLLTASLLTGTVTVTAFGAAALVSAAGIVAFGAGMTVSAAGALLMAAALSGVNASMKSISRNAKAAEKSLSAMETSVDVVQSGLNGLGSIAQSAMSRLASAFDNGANKAKSSGKKIGNNIQSEVKTGVSKLPTIASQSMSKFNSAISSGGSKAVSISLKMSSSIVSSLNSASSGAYNAGRNIGNGLANGMASCLARVRSIAAQLAAAAEAAIRAQAKIYSPSKVSRGLGVDWGTGYALGMKQTYGDVWSASEELVFIPALAAMASPGISLSSSRLHSQLNDEYTYHSNATYTVIVPVELDAREVARITVPYTEEELNKRQIRSNRKKGRA